MRIFRTAEIRDFLLKRLLHFGALKSDFESGDLKKSALCEFGPLTQQAPSTAPSECGRAHFGGE
ncbi:MAG: hypothetical protein ACE5GA_01885 [Candidatus Zixiibacteriota bacterium]